MSGQSRSAIQITTQITTDMIRYMLHWLMLAAMLTCSATGVFAQGPGKVYGEAEGFYERGNYEMAVKKAVEVLRMKDTHRKAQELIQQAWNAFLNRTIGAIREAQVAAGDREGSARVRQLQEVASSYKRIIDLRGECNSIAHIVFKDTGRPVDIGTNDYYAEWQAAREAVKQGESAAAEYHYARGLEFEKAGTMEQWKSAAREFKQANLNSPGFKDSRERYEANRTRATKRLAVIPFENASGQRQYGAIENIITDQVVSALMKDGDAMEFTSIITRDELDRILAEQRLNMTALLDERSVVESGALLGVQQLVIGRINQLSCESAPEIVDKYQRNGQCYAGTRSVVGRDGKTRQEPVYRNASAMITVRRREAKARIIGSFKILDVRSGELIKSDSFTKEQAWSHAWATFTGDECMTNDRNDRALLVEREENPPSCNEMASQVGQQLATYLAGQIANAIR